MRIEVRDAAGCPWLVLTGPDETEPQMRALAAELTKRSATIQRICDGTLIYGMPR